MTGAEKRGIYKNRRGMGIRIAVLALLCSLIVATAIGGICNLLGNPANAYDTGTTPSSIGSLTLSDYDTRLDGQVFDSAVLNKLYDAILGTNGTGTYSALYNKVNNSTSTIYGRGSLTKTYPKSLDYSAISGGTTASDGTKTAPDPVIVEFGGMTWGAVYLTENTTKTTNGTPDLILTLVAAENSTQTYQYAVHQQGWTVGGYAANIYSTSYMRAAVLNGGGDTPINYSTSNTTSFPGVGGIGSAADAKHRTGTVSQSDRIASPYAQFTLSDAVIGKKSLTDYLVAPKYIELQKVESCNDFFTSGNVSLGNIQNESWGRGGVDGVDRPLDSQWNNALTGNVSGVKVGIWQEAYYPQYYEWENDLLWLPSISEIGYAHYTQKLSSLWGIPYNDPLIESNPSVDDCWTRSGGDQEASSGMVMWNGHFCQSETASRSVRPALHLNLTEIAKQFVDEPEIPAASPERTYTCVEQSFDLVGFKNVDMPAPTSIMRTDGTAYDAPSVTQDATNLDKVTVKFTDAGEYKIEFAAPKDKDGKKRFWNSRTRDADHTGTMVKIKFTVEKQALEEPSFGAAQTFDGSTKSLIASNYPSQTSGLPRDALSVVIAKTNGNIIAGDTPVTTAQADGTLKVELRNAGDYKATFTIADAINYKWKDGASGTKDVAFTLNQKTLQITSTTTANNNAWSWAADASDSGTVTVSGIISSDSVNLQLEIIKDGETSTSYITTPTKNADGSYTFAVDKNISKFGGNYIVGTYYLKPVFRSGTGDTHNGNYKFDVVGDTGDAKGYILVVSAAGAGLTDYKLEYCEDGTTSFIDMPTGNKLPYKLNATGTAAVTYTVRIKTAGFAAAFIEVDTSYNSNDFINGCKGVVSEDDVSTYTVQYKLKSTDAAHQIPAGQDVVTLTWEIEKATFDLTGARWQYKDSKNNTAYYPAKWDGTAWVYVDGSNNTIATDKGLPWYGEDYTLTLEGLPIGLTVNHAGAYTNNKQKKLGNYEITVAGGNLSYSTNNFNALPSAFLKFKWNIVQGEVIIDSSSWTSTEQGDTSNLFYVPQLKNVQGIDYEYYDLGTDDNPIAFPGTFVTEGINGLVNVSGTEHNYYVKAVVKAGKSIDGVTDWVDAIKITDQTGGGSYNGQNFGDGTKYFKTGNNKTPVLVSLNGTSFVFNDNPHGVLDDGSNNGELTITVGGNNLNASNFEVKYYEYDAAATGDHFKGTALSSAPKDAGKYVIEVKLNDSAAATYFADNEYFVFEIEPFAFDMSQVKWGYVDKDGVEHDYNPLMPPEYTLNADGTPFEFKMVLLGLPKGDPNGTDDEKQLADFFEKSGLDASKTGSIITYITNSSSSVTNGVATATCEIDVPNLNKNFKLGTLPSIFATDASSGKEKSTLSWKINPKKINIPKSNSTQTFTGNTLDILDFAGLDINDLGVYFNITALTKIDKQNNAQSLFTSANCNNPSAPTVDEIKAILADIKDAGTYGITVQSTNIDNIKWAEGPSSKSDRSAQIKVNKLKIQVEAWDGDGNAPWDALYTDTNYPDGVVDYKFFDMDGNVVDVNNLALNEQYKQTVAPTDGNEDNVEIEFINGAEKEKVFLNLDNSNPPAPITKPTGISTPNATYNGKPLDFMPQGLETLVDNGRVKLYTLGENGEKIYVDKSVFKPTDAGEYKVFAEINGNYYWDGTSNDKSPIEYNFTVDKAKVTPVWSKDSNGKPQAKLPSGMEGLGDIFEYHYYDADGNEVAEGNLEKGGQYKIGVTLKEGVKKNVILTDASGAELGEGEANISEDIYEHPKSAFAGFMTKKMAGLPMYVWFIILFILLLLLILLIILLVKRKKKREEQAASKEEKEEERRRKEEEREEEKRRKEEEREEEKRRKEEEREEEKRRREEDREDERRRREDERRMQMQQAPQVQQPIMPQMPMMMPPQMPMMMQQPQMPMQQQQMPMQQPQMQQQPIYVNGGGDEAGRLREYEDRLRTLEREVQDRRVEAIVRGENERAMKELDEAARIRRHEAEVQRLKDLQEYERRQRQDMNAYYAMPQQQGYYASAEEMARRQQEIEMQQLRLLEEQLKQKQMENSLLQQQLMSRMGEQPPTPPTNGKE